MTKTYTRTELEELLSTHYKGKLCSFSYPGKEIIHGIVNELSVDHQGNVILQIDNTRYEVSLEAFQDCTKIIK